MTWVADRNKTYGLGTSQAQVHATIEAVSAKLRAHPIDRDSLQYDGDAFDRLIGATNDVQYWDFFAETASRLQVAVETPSTVQPDVLRALALQHDLLTDTEPLLENGVWEAVNCEAPWPRDLSIYFADMRYFSVHYPYGWGATGAGPHECTFDTVKCVEPLVKLSRAHYPTGMVVQEQFDPQTPYQGGPAMADLLGHRLLSVPRDGQHVAYGPIHASPRPSTATS